MGLKPLWTAEEVELLEEKWGNISIPAIAKLLNKTEIAIKVKANRIGLGSHLHSGEEITLSQLLATMGKENSFSHWKHIYIKHGCPITYKKSIKKRYMVINIDSFWKWAEKNKHILDFSAFETNSLGKEPDWVAKKRKADLAAEKYKTTPWTKTEDDYLISLLDSYKYGYREISIKLLRTEGAIKRRIIDLGLKQRPLKADNHTLWTDQEIEKVITMVKDGYKPHVIAEYVNRSALAIRGLLERMFDTDVYKMVVKC